MVAVIAVESVSVTDAIALSLRVAHALIPRVAVTVDAVPVAVAGVTYAEIISPVQSLAVAVAVAD